MLNRASNRCMQMLDIIKELLIITQSKSYSNPAEIEAVNINEIINEIVAAEKNTADESGIEIQLNLSDENLIIQAKKSDLLKIIDNLLSNAIRYNKENGTISIETKKQNNQIIIRFQDTGIGIRKEDLDNIFAEFYRTENARKKVNYGTGLGLSLIKQLVENYNGRIDVQSELNVGTTFSINLPFNKGEKR